MKSRQAVDPVMPAAAPGGRDPYIDFLRGVVIVDMILVHYSPYFEAHLIKAINYTDIAMEGFLMVSGFMAGRHYLKRFLSSPGEVTEKLLSRALRLTIVQLALVFTISYPHFLLVATHGDDQLGMRFLIDSLTFRNQIGLMHILPLYIALSMLSPLLLFAAARGLEALLPLSSALIFLAGMSFPQSFAYGAIAIFPIALWQVFYVTGFYFGARLFRENHVFVTRMRNRAILVPIALAIVLLLQHGGTLGVPQTVTESMLGIRRFPLTIGGALRGFTLIGLAVITTTAVWPMLSRLTLVDELCLFGRNSLLVFVIHVYFAKLIEIAAVRLGATGPLVVTVIALNFISCHLFLRYYEAPPVVDRGRPIKALRYLLG